MSMEDSLGTVLSKIKGLSYRISNFDSVSIMTY